MASHRDESDDPQPSHPPRAEDAETAESGMSIYHYRTERKQSIFGSPNVFHNWQGFTLWKWRELARQSSTCLSTVTTVSKKVLLRSIRNLDKRPLTPDDNNSLAYNVSRRKTYCCHTMDPDQATPFTGDAKDVVNRIR